MPALPPIRNLFFVGLRRQPFLPVPKNFRGAMEKPATAPVNKVIKNL
jgi:hypothetical protein